MRRDPDAPELPMDEDTEAILARRDRFIALAVAGLAAGALVSCSETQPQPCLSPPCTVGCSSGGAGGEGGAGGDGTGGQGGLGGLGGDGGTDATGGGGGAGNR